MSDRLVRARIKGLWRLLPHCVALCLLVGCDPRGRGETQYQRYLSRLGHTLSVDIPVVQRPALPGPPGIDQLHLDIPASSLDTLDFLALSGCALQATIGKRNSSLGRMARDSQRLLLALEYLRLAPRCSTYQRERGAAALVDTLERAWQLQRQQLPALIFNATLGGVEYRALWHRSAPGENHPGASSGQVVYALQAINGHARHWLAGEYGADNRAFEILLSEVAAGDGGAPLLDLAGQSLRYRELLPPIAALEELLSSALPPDYRNWKSERNARIAKLATTPDPPVEQLKAGLAARCRSEAGSSTCAGHGHAHDRVNWLHCPTTPVAQADRRF